MGEDVAASRVADLLKGFLDAAAHFAAAGVDGTGPVARVRRDDVKRAAGRVVRLLVPLVNNRVPRVGRLKGNLLRVGIGWLGPAPERAIPSRRGIMHHRVERAVVLVHHAPARKRARNRHRVGEILTRRQVAVGMRLR